MESDQTTPPLIHPSDLRVPIAAELARQYGKMGRDALEDLAAALELALPGQVDIDRHGGWFAKVHPLAGLKLTLEEHTFALECPKDPTKPVRATCARAVRGVVIKTEELDVPEWIGQLGTRLEGHAQKNASAHEALTKWLGPDTL